MSEWQQVLPGRMFGRDQRAGISGPIRKETPQLLHDPTAGGMAGDVEAQNLPPVMANNKEAVQGLEGDRGDREKVHCSDGFARIAKKGQPAPGKFWTSGAPASSNARRFARIRRSRACYRTRLSGLGAVLVVLPVVSFMGSTRVCGSPLPNEVNAWRYLVRQFRHSTQ